MIEICQIKQQYDIILTFELSTQSVTSDDEYGLWQYKTEQSICK